MLKPWENIRKQAEAYIQKESPPTVWPFEKQSWEDLQTKTKKVFAHYFVPFPLSYDNGQTDVDFYNTYLDSAQSDASMASSSFYKKGSGGYIRERPLSVGPWDSPYWQEINYAIEILRAKEIGIDGFSMDILSLNPESPQYQRALMLLEVASHVSPGFPVMLMPDAAAGFKNADIETAADTLLKMSDQPSAYRLEDGRVVIAPFKANGRTPEFWADVLRVMKERGVETAFFPVFLFYENLPENAKAFADISYGMSDWGFRDINFSEEYGLKNAVDTVAPYTKRWMMPVVPQDLRPKDLVVHESQNTGLFRYLWNLAIDTGSEYVQLVTWNDYSECTEIAPSSKIRFLFNDLTAYYTQWFKNGTPSAIQRDAIYYNHREHLLPVKGLNTDKQRASFQMIGKTPIQNRVEMLALLTVAATLEIEQNGKIKRKDAPAGLTVFDVPAETGRPIFRIVRDGKTAEEITSRWSISDTAEVENPIYVGDSTTRN